MTKDIHLQMKELSQSPSRSAKVGAANRRGCGKTAGVGLVRERPRPVSPGAVSPFVPVPRPLGPCRRPLSLSSSLSLSFLGHLSNLRKTGEQEEAEKHPEKYGPLFRKEPQQDLKSAGRHGGGRKTRKRPLLFETRQPSLACSTHRTRVV